MPVTLEWDRSSLTVSEDSGTATLRARAVTTKDKRPEEGFSFGVAVSYSDGTAIQPDDFSPGATTATFDRDRLHPDDRRWPDALPGCEGSSP